MKKSAYISACFFGCLNFYSASQDTIPKNPAFLFIPASHSIKLDSTTYKIPRYKQGVICDFEDQLNRKKIPLNFQLGNSKY
jgi:hypothetical protein